MKNIYLIISPDKYIIDKKVKALISKNKDFEVITYDMEEVSAKQDEINRIKTVIGILGVEKTNYLLDNYHEEIKLLLDKYHHNLQSLMIRLPNK